MECSCESLLLTQTQMATVDSKEKQTPAPGAGRAPSNQATDDFSRFFRELSLDDVAPADAGSNNASRALSAQDVWRKMQFNLPQLDTDDIATLDSAYRIFLASPASVLKVTGSGVTTAGGFCAPVTLQLLRSAAMGARDAVPKDNNASGTATSDSEKKTVDGTEAPAMQRRQQVFHSLCAQLAIQYLCVVMEEICSAVSSSSSYSDGSGTKIASVTVLETAFARLCDCLEPSTLGWMREKRAAELAQVPAFEVGELVTDHEKVVEDPEDFVFEADPETDEDDDDDDDDEDAKGRGVGPSTTTTGPGIGVSFDGDVDKACAALTPVLLKFIEEYWRHDLLSAQECWSLGVPHSVPRLLVNTIERTQHAVSACPENYCSGPQGLNAVLFSMKEHALTIIRDQAVMHPDTIATAVPLYFGRVLQLTEFTSVHKTKTQSDQQTVAVAAGGGRTNTQTAVNILSHLCSSLAGHTSSASGTASAASSNSSQQGHSGVLNAHVWKFLHQHHHWLSQGLVESTSALVTRIQQTSPEEFAVALEHVSELCVVLMWLVLGENSEQQHQETNHGGRGPSSKERTHKHTFTLPGERRGLMTDTMLSNGVVRAVVGLCTQVLPMSLYSSTPSGTEQKQQQQQEPLDYVPTVTERQMGQLPGAVALRSFLQACALRSSAVTHFMMAVPSMIMLLDSSSFRQRFLVESCLWSFCLGLQWYQPLPLPQGGPGSAAAAPALMVDGAAGNNSQTSAGAAQRRAVVRRKNKQGVQAQAQSSSDDTATATAPAPATSIAFDKTIGGVVMRMVRSTSEVLSALVGTGVTESVKPPADALLGQRSQQQHQEEEQRLKQMRARVRALSLFMAVLDGITLYIRVSGVRLLWSQALAPSSSSSSSSASALLAPLVTTLRDSLLHCQRYVRTHGLEPARSPAPREVKAQQAQQQPSSPQGKEADEKKRDMKTTQVATTDTDSDNDDNTQNGTVTDVSDADHSSSSHSTLEKERKSDELSILQRCKSMAVVLKAILADSASARKAD